MPEVLDDIDRRLLALLQADASRAKRREVIDAVAAGYILQGALDRMEYALRG